jgi:hypothetical protein
MKIEQKNSLDATAPVHRPAYKTISGPASQKLPRLLRHWLTGRLLEWPAAHRMIPCFRRDGVSVCGPVRLGLRPGATVGRSPLTPLRGVAYLGAPLPVRRPWAMRSLSCREANGQFAPGRGLPSVPERGLSPASIGSIPHSHTPSPRGLV